MFILFSFYCYLGKNGKNIFDNLNHSSTHKMHTRNYMRKWSASVNRTPTRIKELKQIMRFRNVLFSNTANRSYCCCCPSVCLSVCVCVCDSVSILNQFCSARFLYCSSLREKRLLWRCFFVSSLIACNIYTYVQRGHTTMPLIFKFDFVLRETAHTNRVL